MKPMKQFIHKSLIICYHQTIKCETTVPLSPKQRLPANAIGRKNRMVLSSQCYSKS